MSDSIQAALIEAVDSDRVPAFDFGTIRERAARQALVVAPAPRKRSLLLVAALVGFPCLAAAAAIFPSPALQHSIAASFAKLNVLANVTSFVDATSVDPRAAAKSAAFHLVMPQGLPDGARLSKFEASGSDGTYYTATYDLPNHRTASFMLQKAGPHSRPAPFVIFVETAADRVTKAVKLPARVWIVGDESVLVRSSELSAPEAAAVERAMGAHDAPR